MITDHQRDNEINDLIDNEFLLSLSHHVHDDTPVIALGLLGAAHKANRESAEDEKSGVVAPNGDLQRIYQRIGELMYQHTLNEVTQYCTQSVDSEIEREGL